MPLLALLPDQSRFTPIDDPLAVLPLGAILLCLPAASGGGDGGQLRELKAAHQCNPWAPPVLLAPKFTGDIDQELLDMVIGRESVATIECAEREPGPQELRRCVVERPGPTAEKVCRYMYARDGEQVGESVKCALAGFNPAVVRRHLRGVGLPAPHYWRALLEVSTALTSARQESLNQVGGARAVDSKPRTLSRYCQCCFGATWRDMVSDGWWEWDLERFLRFRGAGGADFS